MGETGLPPGAGACVSLLPRPLPSPGIGAVTRPLVCAIDLVRGPHAAAGDRDSATGQVVLELLRRLSLEKWLPVVLVTHSSLAASHGDRTVERRDGRIVGDVR